MPLSERIIIDQMNKLMLIKFILNGFMKIEVIKKLIDLKIDEIPLI